jgi:hypothetical protein
VYTTRKHYNKTEPQLNLQSFNDEDDDDDDDELSSSQPMFFNQDQVPKSFQQSYVC